MRRASTKSFFTVIVPTVNRIDLIRETLLSIEAQTFDEYEVILVMDGGCREEMSALQNMVQRVGLHCRVEYTARKSGKNYGPSVARNIGLMGAEGTYCAFCDDDDVWVDNRHLEIAYKVLTEHPDIDYYFANQIGCKDGEVVITDWLPHLKEKIGKFECFGDNCYFVNVEEIIDATSFPHVNCTIVSKKLAYRIKGFWEDIRYSEDLDFFLRAVDKAKAIAYRDAVVSKHNIPDRSVKKSASSIPSRLEKQIVYMSICNHIRITCRNPVILAAINRNAGYAMKRAAEVLLKNGSRQAAFYFARQALITLPSWKWLVFTLWLGFKNFIANRRGLFVSGVRADLLKEPSKREKKSVD